MIDVTQAHKESLESFAKNTLDESYGRLDPWCGMNRYSSVLRADLQDVGSVYSSKGQFTFEYKPMTPEEYTKYSGEEVKNSMYADPGGPPNFWDTMVDYEVLNGKYENPWFNYYLAIEDTGSKTTYSAPHDAPWTQEVFTNWSEASDNRCAEAEEVQGVVKDLMEKLYEAAKAYAETDISNAIDLSEYDIDGAGGS